MVLSDAELVKAAQRGDSTSLGLLLERHRAPLYALALRMLGHGPEAQDAVHDAFLIALRKIDQLRNPEAVAGWLRAILHNVCVTRLRKNQGELLFDEVSRHVERRFSEPSAEEEIDRLALREWVWTALSKLPEALRVTAMLRYFGSYASYEEISAILGVPVGTVKSRLNQVKVKLADALLKTAGLAHDEAQELMKSQRRFFAAAFDELDRKGDCEMFASAFSDDLVWALTDGAARSGRASWVHLFELDVEDRVKHPVTSVLASKDVTIVEVDQINPPEDPFHCPPAISMVCFYRDGLVGRMRAYEPPRLNREGG
jgi:RNA polymerase sigma-70 factor (ECF subfamily)